MASTALQMHTGSAKKLMERIHRVQALAEKTKEKTGEVVGTLVHSLEVGAGAFTSGLVKGKLDKSPELMGIPMDLLAAIGLHGAGFLGFGGKHASHLHGFGDGFLASYATTMGLGAGAAWKDKEKKSGKVSGEDIDAALEKAGV